VIDVPRSLTNDIERSWARICNETIEGKPVWRPVRTYDPILEEARTLRR
jgi:hypothetical protein